MPETLVNLQERVALDRVSIDRNAGVIRGVKLLGKESRNGRTYSENALHQASKLYEGAKVRLNHPSRETPTSERSVQETWGEIRGATLKESGVYGDLHFVKEHPSTPHLLEMAERFPKQFGMSQNADGIVESRDGRDIVESLDKVRGLDVVDQPATTNGLFESALSENHFGMGAVGMEAPAEGTTDEKVRDSLRDMILAVIEDESMTGKEMAESIRKVLEVRDDVLSKTEEEEDPALGMEDHDHEHADETEDPEAPEEEENEMPKEPEKKVDPKAKKKPFGESHKQEPNPDVVALREEVREIRAKQEADEYAALLEEVGIEASEFHVKQLSRCEGNDERKALIESWLPGAGSARPQSTGRLYESEGGESYADMTKDGFVEALR